MLCDPGEWGATITQRLAHEVRLIINNRDPSKLGDRFVDGGPTFRANSVVGDIEVAQVVQHACAAEDDLGKGKRSWCAVHMGVRAVF